METAKQESVLAEFRQFDDLVPKIKAETGRNFTENPLLFETLFDLLRSQVINNQRTGTRLLSYSDLVSFKPFISGGNDGIFPALLQKGANVLQSLPGLGITTDYVDKG